MNKLRARFEKYLPNIKEVARKLGYAITTHGSMERDFDIVAIPWTKDAVSSSEVATAIRAAADSTNWRCPHAKDGAPHGREWWPFDWHDSSKENKDYVDMSIMPRMDWISVLKKLPKDGRQVWTYFLPSKDMYFAIYEDGQWWDGKDLEDDWHGYTEKVTHWMQLPKSPI